MEESLPPGEPPNSPLMRSPATKRTRNANDPPTQSKGGNLQARPDMGKENSFSFKDAILNKRYQPKLTWEDVLEDFNEDTTMGEADWDVCDTENTKWPLLKVTKEEHDELYQPWRSTLIVKVLGKSVGYNFLLDRLQQLWKLEEGFSLVDLGNNFFLVRVSNPDDYNSIMTKGPWIVAGHYLTMRKWKPLFRPHQEPIRFTLVWGVNQESEPRKNVDETITQQPHEEINVEARYGPWMLAQRRPKRNNARPNHQGATKAQSTAGSRFAPLEGMEKEMSETPKSMTDGASSSKAQQNPRPNNGKSKALTDITNDQSSMHVKLGPKTAQTIDHTRKAKSKPKSTFTLPKSNTDTIPSLSQTLSCSPSPKPLAVTPPTSSTPFTFSSSPSTNTVQPNPTNIQVNGGDHDKTDSPPPPQIDMDWAGVGETRDCPTADDSGYSGGIWLL
ncbi:hypothetical protein CCACVL1_05022 [Corchorus capsularis]|uniref:DUF4283 domain-containing protein n=1 Tax=Corchorus capsularis TaxID=210143 RepID=A0A1R3JN11_COCAP|nr:hypothetical protein CCACVL1_05022 [Corchorus capsularis]